MLLAASSSSYPLLNIFWTMFIFFLWVLWIWILIMVFIDIFRSHDRSGIHIHRVRRGRLVEQWEELNLLGVLRQLGVPS